MTGMSDATTNGVPAPRPYISKLSVKGFKSIREADIELGRLNVLIGANGSGKSNLGSLLRLMNAHGEERLQAFSNQSGGINSLLHFGARRTERIHASATFSDDKPLVTHSVAFQFGSGDQIYPFSEVMMLQDRGFPIDPPGQTKLGDWHSIAGSPRNVGARSSDRDLVISNAPRLVVPLQFWPAIGVYHFADTSPEARIRLTGDIDDNHRLRGDGRNLAAFLYGLMRVRPEYFQLITRVVRLVAPYFDRFVLQSSRENVRTIQLRWQEIGADDSFGAHLLSDGTLRFIALATLLLQPKDELPSLIFLDEPEIGLHPAALTHLAGMIHTAAFSTQVIVATQSTYLLNQFEPSDVVVTELHSGESTFQRLRPEELTEWLADYSLGDLWLKNVIGGRPSR
jgi:predicted ATPase